MPEDGRTIPLKPYLIRAVRNWAVDSGLTPCVLVNASLPGVKVPADYVDNGRIVLNVHPRAVGRFDLDNEWLQFSARFAARSFAVEVPLAAVLAVYARENGQGISFTGEEDADGDGAAMRDAAPSKRTPRKGPTLKIVK